MAKLRRLLDGTGPLSGLGLAFWLVGLVMFGAILMSPNGWGWWMDVHSVQGREIDGLVYYAVDGVSYTLDDPQSFPGDRPHPRTVYYLPAQPGNSSLSNLGTEVMDWGLTAGPAAAGLVLVAWGFSRRARRTRSAPSRDRDSFGHGLPSDTIRAIIERDNPTRA